MPKQITDLEIDEVSLVAKGANQHAKVTIAKSAKGNDTMGELFDENGSPVEEDSLQHGQVVFDGEGEAYVYEEDGQEPIDTDQLLMDFDDENADDLEFAEVGKAFNPINSLKRAKAMRGLAHGSKMPKSRMLGPGTSGRAGGQSFASMGAPRTSTSFKNGGTVSGKGAGRARRAAGTAGGYAAAGGYKAQSAGYRAQAAGYKGLNTANRSLMNHPGTYAAGAAGAGAGYGAHKWKGGKSASFADEVREELSKSLTDKDRDEVISKALGRMEEMDEIAKSALQAATDERDLRLHREYTEIAKSYNLPVEDEALGTALMHCAESLSDEDCEVIAKCLGAAGEVLFEEYGAVGGGDNADVFSRVTGEVAKSMGQQELSTDQMVELLTANPDLYDEYLSGQNF